MNCFCSYLITKSQTMAVSYQFTDINPQDQVKYCSDYYWVYVQQKVIIYGSSMMIIFINALINYIFELISGWEKHHSESEQTIYQFKKIVIMQFVNIALIVLLVNFNLQNQYAEDGGKGLWLLGFMPILRGQYVDFSVGWYNNVGTVLCITLLINILSPHGSLLFQPTLNLMARCWDRDCGCTIRKKGKKSKKKEDGVNTKKEL